MAQDTRAEARDGFIIRDRTNGEEADFIACTMDGRMREKVENGLLLRVDFQRFYVDDTRWED